MTYCKGKRGAYAGSFLLQSDVMSRYNLMNLSTSHRYSSVLVSAGSEDFLIRVVVRY